jgi:hypothetical protein
MEGMRPHEWTASKVAGLSPHWPVTLGQPLDIEGGGWTKVSVINKMGDYEGLQDLEFRYWKGENAICMTVFHKQHNGSSASDVPLNPGILRQHSLFQLLKNLNTTLYLKN